MPNFIAATVTRVAARIAMINQCQDLALGRGSSRAGIFFIFVARHCLGSLDICARRVQRNPRMATSAKDATARIDPLHFVKVRERPRRLHCALLHVHPAVSARFTPDLRTPRTLHASPAHPPQSNPLLAPFLRDDFDGIAYASDVLAEGSVQTATSALDAGIDALDRAVEAEVTSHYDDLLAQLAGIGEADRVLDVLRGGVHSLQDTMGRVREEIVEPHRTVSAKTRQLENITRTADLLRRVSRSVKLGSRLRECLEKSRSGANQTSSTVGSRPSPSSSRVGDLAKAAKMLSDAKELEAEGETDLVGVGVCDADRRYFADAARDVRAEAKAALDEGMGATSQAEVGAALQVFYNLGELAEAVDAQIAALAQIAADGVRDALDPRELSREMGGGVGESSGRAGRPPAGREKEWAEALWARIERAMDGAHRAGIKAWHLQRVLAKKRDPLSNAVFLDAYAAEASKSAAAGCELPCERFIAAFGKGAGEALQRANAQAGFARDVLLSGYPRLVAAIERAHDQLRRDSDASARGSGAGPPPPPAVRRDGADLSVMLRAGDAIANAYLSRSFQRLSEPVNALLSPSALQSLRGMVTSAGGARDGTASLGTIGTRRATDDTRRYLARVREELDAVSNHPKLLTQVTTSAVAKSIRLIAQKAETGTSVAAEARSFVVGQPATPAQRCNIALAATLEETHTAMSCLAPLLPDEPRASLTRALDQLAEATREALEPTLEAAAERCARLIATIHEEDWAAGDPPSERCSPYAAKLIATVEHLRTEHLGALGGGPGAGAKSPSTLAVAAFAERILELFTRHVCLVRDLGENGKMRLTKDMGELESAVEEHLRPVASLGAPYKALRALRPYLFLTTEEIASSEAVKDLPTTCALMHLYSRVPRELATPYQRAGLTPALYSKWLDKHDDDEAWEGVKQTLDAYEAKGNSNPVVEVMRTIGGR